MKSSNSHIDLGTNRSVVDIQVPKPARNKKNAEEELPAQPDELPLTDFERNMDRLQNLESETGLPDILSQLEENYKGERENIYQSGFDAGLEAGKKEMQRQYQNEMQAVNTILDQLQESRWRLEREAELNVIELIMQIARRVIASELQQTPAKIENVLRETLSHIENDEVLEIHLNPEDYDYITQQSDVPKSLNPDVKIKKSTSMERGGCLVQTNMESIDATIESKLEQISRQLYANIPVDGA